MCVCARVCVRVSVFSGWEGVVRGPVEQDTCRN